jgi:hypothetical protein
VYRSAISVFIVLGAGVALFSADPVEQRIAVDGSGYYFYLGESRVAAYHPGIAKPYLFPLRAPIGIGVTRSWPVEPKPLVSMDHVHQKSAWFAHGEVTLERDGIANSKAIDFWSEAPGHGNIALVQTPGRESELSLPKLGKPLRLLHEWKTAEGQPLLTDTRTIGVYEVAPGRLVVFETDLLAKFGAVIFGDTKEGAFGVRVHDELRIGDRDHINPKSRITNAEGKQGEKACWGYTSNWCDYSGEIDGKPVGIALFDDLSNKPRSCWHVRDYGLMAANPFGRQKSGFPAMRGRTDLVRLAKDQHLKLRYGIYLHDGDASVGKVADAYEQFVKLRF